MLRLPDTYTFLLSTSASSSQKIDTTPASRAIVITSSEDESSRHRPNALDASHLFPRLLSSKRRGCSTDAIASCLRYTTARKTKAPGLGSEALGTTRSRFNGVDRDVPAGGSCPWMILLAANVAL
jgi:hypothetical protein